MPIKYCWACELSSNTPEIEIIGEYPTNQKYYREVLHLVIQRLPRGDTRQSLQKDDVIFHIQRTGQFAYALVATSDFPLRVCFACLSDVSTQHLRTRSTNIKSLLKEKLAYYNNLSNDKISKMRNQIDQVKEVMLENIDKVLERGEKLDELVDQTEDLAIESMAFSGKSTTLKRSMLIRNIIIAIFTVICIIALLFIIVLIIVIAVCGVDFNTCKSTNK